MTLTLSQRLVFSFAALAALTHIPNTANSATTHQEKIMSNNYKQQVTSLLKSIETGDQKPVAFINPNKYTQHNLAVGDGLAGFGAVLQAPPKNTAKVNTARIFQDGDYVIAHTDYNFFGPKVGFDIFRFENGLIVEHWDNLQEKPVAPNPSGNTMLDGSSQPMLATSCYVENVRAEKFLPASWHRCFPRLEISHAARTHTAVIRASMLRGWQD